MKKPELLAPAGDYTCFQAALKAGADAVKSIDRIVDNMEDILPLSDDSPAAKPYLFILRGRMPQSLQKSGGFTRPSAI